MKYVKLILIIAVLCPSNLLLACPSFCDCSDGLLQCTKPETVTAFPVISKEIAGSIRKIKINNQRNLKEIESKTLEFFVNLTNIDLSNTGLEQIEHNAFSHSHEAQVINLSDTNLKVFEYAAVKNNRVRIKNIFLTNNPELCLEHCLNIWMDLYSNKGLRDSQFIKFENKTILISKNDLYVMDEQDLQNFDPKSFYSLPEAMKLDSTTCLNESNPCVPETPRFTRGKQFYTAGENLDAVCEKNASIPGKILMKLERHETHEGHYILRNLDVMDSGWLICALSQGQYPAMAIMPIYVDGPPEIIPYPDGNHNGEFAYDVIGVFSPSITVTPLVNTSAEPNDVNVDGPSGLRFYHESVTIEFHHPNGIAFLCLGNYSLTACTEHGCYTELVYIPGGKPSSQCTPNESPFVIISAAENATDTLKSYSRTHFSIWIVLSLLVLAALSTVCIICFLMHRKNKTRPRRSIRRGTIRPEYDPAVLQLIRTEHVDVQQNQLYFTWLRDFSSRSDVPLIREDELDIVHLLGEGAFGYVYLVKYTEAQNIDSLNGQNPHMAMKLVKYNTIDRAGDFEKEAEILSTLDHPNIVKFLGLSYKNGQSALLFEYMEHGDLVNYLRSNQPSSGYESQLNEEKLALISLQIACGMEYLADNHLVHRDLACRNCLVGAGLVVKVSDFGMTRDVYVSDYYKMDSRTLVPLRWLPPESIMYRKFTIESDVWSFGVVLWEVFSFGQVPWCAYSNQEVIDCITAGKVLQIPDTCPEQMYELMLHCWKPVAQDRQTMRELRKSLEAISENYANDAKLTIISL